MQSLQPYRDPAAVQALLARLADRCTRPWTVMEICGGQTHSLLRHGLLDLLPPSLTLIHGPGCPVCVTAAETVDQAIALARQPEVMLCSFGDMLRVPGSEGSSLLAARSQGADVRILYSPLDAIALAQAHPLRQVVFFAVGFETTAPTTALAVIQAEALGLRNLSLLTAHVRVPPAMGALLADPDCRVQSFLAAGHVCSVMGTDEYGAIAHQHRRPVIVTGFEPVDLLRGLLAAVTQLEQGRAELENHYARAVNSAGNRAARARVAQVFEPVARVWRGIGVIPASGLGLRPAYARFDALHRFGLGGEVLASPSSPCGQVLCGQLRPNQCPEFGSGCRPEHPLGAPMVSSEGACAAYYRYRPAQVA